MYKNLLSKTIFLHILCCVFIRSNYSFYIIGGQAISKKVVLKDPYN